MNKPLLETVNLPGSKSESNRALMMAAYGGFPLEVENLSEAHDTVLLAKLLERIRSSNPSHEVVLDCEDAGAVARFLMTYLAGKPGNWLLTGTTRLCERPMAPLITTLRQLGADINCSVTEGCLPVGIKGKYIRGGDVSLDASQSSQFATSLLMAAPTWEKGLRLMLKTEPVSEPYLNMTIAMMDYFGVRVFRDGQTITVNPQPYQFRKFRVAPDWSAASFWYEWVALSDGGGLFLNGLMANSLQGDSVVSDRFAKLGVKTVFTENGVCISKEEPTSFQLNEPIVFDFKTTPDLFPSIFTTCIALHINSVFKGISTLYNKESDRINSLITELSRIYTFINIVYDDKIIIEKSSLTIGYEDSKKVVFNTYHDHRIAMALAALAPRFGAIAIDNPSVVNKSYPTFWNELKKLL